MHKGGRKISRLCVFLNQFELLDLCILAEAVSSLAVDNGVNACDFILALDPEANGLLNSEADNKGKHEAVGKNTKGCNLRRYVR